LAALILSACNLPSKNPASQDPNAAMTAAAQTIAAQLTMVAPLNTATIPVIVPNTNTPVSVPPTAFIPSATSLPPTATPICDGAQFIADVTVPDGTVYAPNQTFTKTWRLKNTGTCSWTPSYAVAFSDGNSMNGPATQALVGNVNPGQTIDISMNLTAPATPGDYTGNYRLRNAAGLLFSKFYVQIKVQNSATATNTVNPDANFAVTGVTYSVSTWSSGGSVNCPRIIANITTNGAGTVKYTWTSTSDTNSPETLDFSSASTKTINYDWPRASTWAGTPAAVGIYINSPNHQDFGQQTFTIACTTP
jgi:hypothetical protein